ncbi:MAG: alpha/beta hydrolase [Bacteroidota bacterium]
MSIERNTIIERAGRKPILVDIFKTSESTNQPIVIFCHGYKGFKDWGAWNLMTKHISDAGYCVIKFNFSHNGGTMEQPIDFPDLEAFGQNNYSLELEDLDDVISWAITRFKSNPTVNTDQVTLMGHSRGGGIVLIKAAEDPRISKVITLASVSDYKSRFVKGEALEQWKNEGVMHIVNGRTQQQMPHYYQFYEDFTTNEERLTIKRAVKQINIPLLIIHGSDDPTVTVDAAKALHEWQPKSSILKIIDGADHVFNVKHPWDKHELSKEMLEVCHLVVRFLG